MNDGKERDRDTFKLIFFIFGIYDFFVVRNVFLNQCLPVNVLDESQESFC